MMPRQLGGQYFLMLCLDGIRSPTRYFATRFCSAPVDLAFAGMDARFRQFQELEEVEAALTQRTRMSGLEDKALRKND